MSEPLPSPPADAAGQTLLTQNGLPVGHVGETLAPSAAEVTIPLPPSKVRVIAGYAIEKELGRGGMGVVYKVRDRRLGRTVALKMILSGSHAGTEDMLRFLSEAQAVAGLQHPHIVQIYEIDQHEGLPFFTLEYIPGGSLASRLRGEPQTPRDAARHLELLARAIDHAHRAGVVHRDLKPANVLLLEEDKTPLARCTPKVTDFGLAKRTEGDSGMTRSGAIIGTPSYMAPEQAAGKTREVGPAADTYSLGAILYELLTGRPPFRAATVAETLMQVLTDEPVPVRQLQPGTPRDLETICHKCLHKDAKKRYASSGDLADDLLRFQKGEPIQARPVGRLERSWHWCRRNPVVAPLLTLLVVVILTAGVLITWQWQSSVAALHRVEQEQRARALSQVNALRTAEVGAVPALLKELEDNRDTVLPRLQELWQQGAERGQRMRVGLALLAVEPETVRDELTAWMLETPDPAEAVLVRDVLAPQATVLRAALWSKAGDDTAKPAVRFRCLIALAAFAPDDQRWDKLAAVAIAEMLQANPLHLGVWIQALHPVWEKLLAPLARVYREARSPERREFAATVLADYAAGKLDVLADLLLDADPKQYAILFPIVDTQRAAAVTLMRQEIARLLEPPDPQRPVLNRKDRERRARRQATAAVTVLKMGPSEDAWEVYRHREDPEVRSQLIWRGGLLVLDPKQLVQRLEQEPDVTAQRALIVALGEFTGQQLPESVRRPLVEKLLQMYRQHPDPGIHGAIDWLLRHAKEGPVDRLLDWGQAKALQQIDVELMKRDAKVASGGHQPASEGHKPPERRWYVNGQGQTMVLIPGPVEFSMGSPPSDPERRNDEKPHRRRIPRNFAIAAKSVTVEEFQRFLKDRPDVLLPATNEYSPHPEGPIIAVSWFMAAQYCNWLSAKEGISETEWCYPRHDLIKAGMKSLPGYLKRKGYRLPTEAEWECAARAETVSNHCYGSSLELLPRYAWHIHNAEERAWPVGQKRPNDLGLFDVHGNVWNWVQDRYLAYPDQKGTSAVIDTEEMGDIADMHSRVLRGGSFSVQARSVRAPIRYDIRPSGRAYSGGFRVARTYD